MTNLTIQYGDLISVVIPCYNRARSIERAIHGVLLQSYPNLELIVVDDASTDASPEIVEAINDPRLRLIRHETNTGAGAARNTGVAAAQGALIAFQDSDDNWFPEKLDVQMRHFCSLPEDYVAVFCTKIIYGRSIDRGGRKTYGIRHASCVPGPGEPPKSGDLSQAFLSGNFMGPPTVLLKAAAFNAAGGYDLRLRNNDDWDFHIRLSRIGCIGFIDEPLILVYDSADGISKNPIAQAFSTIVIFNKIKRHAPETLALAKHAVAVHRHLMFKGKHRSARRFLHKALQITPKAWRLYLRLALTYVPGFYTSLLQGRRRNMVRHPARML
jgi:glycosyltransferase involved in cell wall biosynthesis